jgi:hypothetical protein
MSHKKVMAMVVGGVLLLIVLSSSVVFLWGVYNKHWENGVATSVANALPIPAAKVGSRTVLLRDYFDGLTSLRVYLSFSEQALAQAQRPSTVSDDDRKNILERLIQEQVLEEVAATRNVTASDAQIDAIMNELNVTATSTASFEDFIAKNYGWSVADFKRHIARPLVLTRLLSTSFAADHGGDAEALTTYLMERSQHSDVVRYIKF